MNKKTRQELSNQFSRDVKKANLLQQRVDNGLSADIRSSVAKPLKRIDDLLRDITEVLDQPSRAGKKKGGTEGDLKHALRKISQSIGSTSWPKVKKVLKKSSSKIRDLYESKTDPINIHDFQLIGLHDDRREERNAVRLLFKTRSGKEVKRKITTVKNILSQIKL